MRTYGGNGGGECCSFPFIYKGKQYNECTTVDAARVGLISLPWCAVTPNYDRDRKRGICIQELGEFVSYVYLRTLLENSVNEESLSLHSVVTMSCGITIPIAQTLFDEMCIS